MVQTIVLECAGRSVRSGSGGNGDADGGVGSTQGPADRDDTVFFHLWDEQMCLATLFQKGDGLAIFWPWVMQSDDHDTPGGRSVPSQQPLALSSQVRDCTVPV